jgi:hypothetical protein
MKDWEEEFRKVDYYPGSSTKINKQSVERVYVPSEDGWDSHPRNYKLKGKDTDFFSLGDLAKALGRKPVTLRKWEAQGVIPKSTYQRPSEDPRGRRRLYTRPQIEGIVRIAREEGILKSHNKPIKNTAFTDKVVNLFKELIGG